MNKFRVSIHDGEMPDGAPVALEALDIATALTIADINVGAGDAEIWDGEMGVLDTAKMALGMTVHDDAEEQHVKQTQL